MDHEAIRTHVKACMFDQYGTVVDMQGGLTAIAAPFLEKKGWSGNPNSFVTWWRRTHFENSMIDALLHREHTPYREIGHRAVAHVMDRAGIKYTKDEVSRMQPGDYVEEVACRRGPKIKRKSLRSQLSPGDPLPGKEEEECRRHSAYEL